MKSAASTKLMQFVCAEDWVSTLFRTHSRPKEAKRWVRMQSDGDSFTEQLPLHQACASCPPVEVVGSLLAAYPESCTKRDTFFRRNALHIACMNGASLEVIRLLISKDETCARAADKLGRLPLHYALFSSLTPEVVQLLLGVYPEGAQVQDYKGWLPLHVGARQSAASEVIAALVEAYPASVEVPTVSGMTAQDISEKFGSHLLQTKSLLCDKPPTEICIPLRVEIETPEQPTLAKPWTCVGAYLVDESN